MIPDGPQRAPIALERTQTTHGLAAHISPHLAGVTAKLNAAVNALGKARPTDPMAFLLAELSKK